ncbi:hypothetical protein PIB30_082752 [Stylosanthes scabra]|uniref:Uncharacterized protein n=1 Tax=Stylosanthes scabra TaxID=79078 RepID=A0ABU6ST54_9FABA|nr:hypothetical protein [Stylosanthes scabra]
MGTILYSLTYYLIQSGALAGGSPEFRKDFGHQVTTGQTWVKRDGRRVRGGRGGGVLATFGTWLGQVQTWHGKGVSKGGLVKGKGEHHVGTMMRANPYNSRQSGKCIGSSSIHKRVGYHSQRGEGQQSLFLTSIPLSRSNDNNATLMQISQTRT